MKRTFTLALALVMVLSLSGCSKSKAAKDVDDQIKAIGEVRWTAGTRLQRQLK